MRQTTEEDAKLNYPAYKIVKNGFCDWYVYMWSSSFYSPGEYCWSFITSFSSDRKARRYVNDMLNPVIRVEYPETAEYYVK